MIQSGSSAGLQNKHEPEKQYVTRKNYIGFRGKKVKVIQIFYTDFGHFVITTWKAKGIAWEKHQIGMNDGDDDGGWPSSTWLESITFETGKRSQDPPWHQTFRIIDTCLSQNQTALKPDWPWMPLPTSNKDILHFSFGASLAGPLYQRYVGRKKAGRYRRVGRRMTITERHLW